MLGKIEGKRIRRWQRMRQLDSVTDSMDMSLARWWTTGSLMCCSPWTQKVIHNLPMNGKVTPVENHRPSASQDYKTNLNTSS